MHESLEYTWGIGEPKQHHLEYVEALFACKYSPVPMLWCNIYLVVPTL